MVGDSVVPLVYTHCCRAKRLRRSLLWSLCDCPSTHMGDMAVIRHSDRQPSAAERKCTNIQIQ